jgi:hypothetical protein
MAKIRKFFRCPWCNQLLTLEVDTGMKTDRWPVKMEGSHGDHDYTVLFDSQFAVTDVKKRPKKSH